MAFNSRNNNRNKINANTRIIQLYNEKAGEDSSTMTLGLWNNYVSVNINPMLPKSEQVDGKMYNYEQTASVLLTIDNIIQLQTGIKLLEKEERAEKEGKARKITSVAVRSQNVVLKVGGAGEYDGINSKYLALFSVNDSGNVDGNLFYVFTNPDNGLMINWDEETNSSKNKIINTQWEEFKLFIDYCANNLILGGAHGAVREVAIQSNKLGNIAETTKALIENMMGSQSNSSSGGVSRANNGGFSGGSRRRRSSVSLTEADISDDDDDEAPDFINTDDYEDDEVDFNEEPKKKSSKKPTKTSSKKSSKKSNKRISVEDIEADMEDEVDDLSDLD